MTGGGLLLQRSTTCVVARSYCRSIIHQRISTTTTPTHFLLRRHSPLLATFTTSSSNTTTTNVSYACNNINNHRRWFSSYPSHEVVGLPSLSPTMESGSIANWSVKAGDSFGPGDVLCSVETDKATVDFEAQDEGYVAKVLVQAGPDEIKVGSPIMVITDSEDKVAAFVNFTLTAGATAAAPAAPAPPPVVEAVALSPPPVAVQAAASTPAPVAAATASSSSSSGRVVASPLAHKLAKEMGYDISKMVGTGPDGRIIASDVKEYVPAAAPTAVAAAAVPAAAPTMTMMTTPATTSIPIPGHGFTDYPLSDAAREIAARLQQSKRNVPHYYLTVDISVDKLLELRESLNASTASSTTKLGVYEFLIKAAAASMKAVPSVNAAWMDSHVRVYDAVDMNVVLGSGDSLVAPILSNVSRKGLAAISNELATMTEQVTDGGETTLPSGGLGTFTIMNFGMYGIKSCAPIIREPQSSALALGALENRIVPNDDSSSSDDDSIYKESVMLTATLSCDHRVVDGAVGAQWLAAFKSHVENPVTLLL